jgi:hypothetical protein
LPRRRSPGVWRSFSRRTEAFLLPLMDWTTDEARASRAWDGEDLFASRLRDAYLDTLAHTDQLPADLLRALLSHLAAVAVYCAADPMTWVMDFTARASEEQRVEWMIHIEQLLQGL